MFFWSKNGFVFFRLNVCLIKLVVDQMVVWSKSVFLLNVFLDQIVFLINFLSTNLFFWFVDQMFFDQQAFFVCLIECFVYQMFYFIKCLLDQKPFFFIKWVLLSIFLIKIRFSFFYYLFFDQMCFFNQTTFLVIKGFFARQCWTVACKQKIGNKGYPTRS